MQMLKAISVKKYQDCKFYFITLNRNQTGNDESSIAQKFFIKIADYCFRYDVKGIKKDQNEYSAIFREDIDMGSLGMTDLIGDYIQDEIIEGNEYQVITPKELFNCLRAYGIVPYNESDYETIEKILKLTSLDTRYIMINDLINIILSLGICEHKPSDTPFLTYSSLQGREIRILNRLIYFSQRNKMKDIKVLFGTYIFTQKVISKKNQGKEGIIELMSTNDFFEILKKFNITKTIELQQNLQNLLCLSKDRGDIIMVKKLEIVIK